MIEKMFGHTLLLMKPQSNELVATAHLLLNTHPDKTDRTVASFQ